MILIREDVSNAPSLALFVKVELVYRLVTNRIVATRTRIGRVTSATASPQFFLNLIGEIDRPGTR